MARQLSGEATEQEKADLAKLLEGDIASQRQFILLQQLWNNTGSGEGKYEPAKISRILQLSAVEEALIEEPETRVAPTRKRDKIYRWAAICLLVFLIGWGIRMWQQGGLNSEAGQVVANKGTQTRTILPDGSTVWLNAGSRIEYEPGFTAKSREVTLYGEAFFNIIKQSGRPFIVHAGGIDIKVLGTSFNVKSYPGDKTVETTLIKGLVQITKSGDPKQEPIFLHPLQKIVLPVANSEIQNTHTAPVSKLPGSQVSGLDLLPAISFLDSTKTEAEYPETAWMYNRLSFRGDSFETLAPKLERWYNISIHFEDDKVKQLTFNGSIENETIEQTFQALKEAVPFNFKITNNEVFISAIK